MEMMTPMTMAIASPRLHEQAELGPKHGWDYIN